MRRGSCQFEIVMRKRIFITVGEVSGDEHAAALVRALREIDPTILIEGHGGDAMRQAGVSVHQETVKTAAMLVKAISKSVEVWKMIRWTKNYFQQEKFDLHICIDSSGMNLHFAKMARSMHVPVLYYIAPQLWASRAGRIKQVRQYVDRIACILPFEEEYYRARGVNVTFVGHPLFDQLPMDHPVARPAVDLPPGDTSSPLIGLMPGSRKSEVVANWPPILDVAAAIKVVYPRARFQVPTTTTTDDRVRAMAEQWHIQSPGQKLELEIAPKALDQFAPQWDLCIAKSGTTTLAVAAYQVPMIVVYRLSKMIWNLVGRWIIKTPSIALVNILAECSPAHSASPRFRIVPEIIPWNGPSKPVADLAIELLKSSERRADQQSNIRRLLATIDRRGASQKTAGIVMDMISGKQD